MSSAGTETVNDALTTLYRRPGFLLRRANQIAAALFITVKAVEWHLGNTYRKLGIRSRGQLSDVLEPTAA